ncbi:metalloregulator ArsR/SmtB family transcription factor [Microbacterium maritypicum]|uniref:ArsR/SmtB family transcription factor n=1 Tax=Microbacterium maritypicum TaxID=33918 RepID=UPI002672558D|nr:metalloregulator ArsR/SmtB family transcription factor [Microbacterium liquefaciens]WKT89581.1 metalloregulator ArsR/SmtB family transcription factor [Microbacterium liquefaciens]
MAHTDETSAARPDNSYVELAVEVFSMLADATRVRLILALRDGEQAVSELAAIVGKSPTVVSQHLAKLRLTRIVTTRHEGTRVFYRLVDEHAVNLVDESIKQAEHAIGTPHHHRVAAAQLD